MCLIEPLPEDIGCNESYSLKTGLNLYPTHICVKLNHLDSVTYLREDCSVKLIENGLCINTVDGEITIHFDNEKLTERICHDLFAQWIWEVEEVQPISIATENLWWALYSTHNTNQEGGAKAHLAYKGKQLCGAKSRFSYFDSSPVDNAPIDIYVTSGLGSGQLCKKCAKAAQKIYDKK